MGDPKHPLSYYAFLLQFTWVGLHYISIYCPDSSVLCFTLRSGQPEYLQLSFGFLSGARNRWRFCLSSYLFLSVQLFYFSSGIHKLLFIWDVYCICFQADIMYYVLRVCYSSFMNYYGFLYSAASYSDMFCVCDSVYLISFAPNLFTICYFELFKPDMCGLLSIWMVQNSGSLQLVSELWF